MKDIDGKQLQSEARDIDLLTDFELLPRPQQNTDEELKKLVNTEVHYSKDVPMTYWVEKLNHGNFYKSTHSANEQTAFAKNNSFLKEFHDYTHKKL